MVFRSARNWWELFSSISALILLSISRAVDSETSIYLLSSQPEIPFFVWVTKNIAQNHFNNGSLVPANIVAHKHSHQEIALTTHH